MKPPKNIPRLIGIPIVAFIVAANAWLGLRYSMPLFWFAMFMLAAFTLVMFLPKQALIVVGAIRNAMQFAIDWSRKAFVAAKQYPIVIAGTLFVLLVALAFWLHWVSL